MKLRVSILVTVIAAELIVLFFLGRSIGVKHRNPSYAALISVNPIEQAKLFFPQVKHLKYFYDLKPSITINELSVPNVHYTINSDSLNERFEYPVEKSIDTFRIINIGDSWGFGMFVNTNENYSELLEDLLNTKLSCSSYKKFEVINLALYGYDLEYMVERFKQKGEKYNADLVIFFVKGDDLSQPNELVKPRVEYYRQQDEKSGKIDIMRERTFWEKAVEDIRQEPGETMVLERSKKNLAAFQEIYKNPVLFLSNGWLGDRDKALLHEFGKTHPSRVYFYDITEKGKFPDELKIPNHGHPNEEGSKRIAHGLSNFLTENHLVPCRQVSKSRPSALHAVYQNQFCHL